MAGMSKNSNEVKNDWKQPTAEAVSISTAHVIGVQEHETKTKRDWKRRTTDQIIDV